MMTKITNVKDLSLRDHVDRLLDYMYNDEYRNWLEEGKPNDNHIFHSLIELGRHVGIEIEMDEEEEEV
jgi:hypothetical protein